MGVIHYLNSLENFRLKIAILLFNLQMPQNIISSTKYLFSWDFLKINSVVCQYFETVQKQVLNLSITRTEKPS